VWTERANATRRFRVVSRWNRLRRTRIGSTLAIALILGACERGPSSDAPAPALVRPTAVRALDVRGHEIVLDAPARRVVSIAPSGTEIVFALGAGSVLIGRDVWSDHPEAARAIPSIGDVYPRPNFEAILELSPDLVLAAGVTSQDVAAAFEAIGLRVWLGAPARSMRVAFDDIRRIGALLGLDDRAALLVRDLERRVGVIQGLVAGRARRRVFYEIDGSDPSRPWTAGTGTLIDEIIDIAGGENIARRGGEAWFAMSLEAIIIADPELVLVGTSRDTSVRLTDVARRPGWKDLAAVRAGRIHTVSDDVVSRPGPRLVDALEAFARLFHPELFEEETPSHGE
jgi:iron complex transport system substrate-binding protein